MRMPLVTVVIPTFNRRHLIEEALDSVFAQSFTDYEVVLVDDGSTDGTETLVKKKYGERLRYIRQENQGISGARNTGIANASGKYVAFLDSDDKWLPQKLARQVAYMEAHPEIGLLSTKLARYELGDKSEVEICPVDFPKDFQMLLTGNNNVPTTTTMVRKECFEKSGIFDRSLPVAEDWDLWLRIAEHYGLACVDEVLAEHRDHSQKTTQNLAKTYEGYWRFYTKTAELYGGRIPNLTEYHRRAQSFRYLLGVHHLRGGDPVRAFAHIGCTLAKDPGVGLYFSRGCTNPVKHLIAFLKPYGAYAAAFLRVPFAKAG